VSHDRGYGLPNGRRSARVSTAAWAWRRVVVDLTVGVARWGHAVGRLGASPHRSPRRSAGRRRGVTTARAAPGGCAAI